MHLRFADFNNIELIEPDNKIIRHDSESRTLIYDSIKNISSDSEISESLSMFEMFLIENL
jgi:hypothetical protein